MKRFSITEAWEDTTAFVRREIGLLLPTAFATMGVAGLIWDLAVPMSVAGQRVPPGPWMLAIVPVLALTLLGAIAISVLALRGGVSVGEALAAAGRRLPLAVLALLLFAGGAVLVATVLTAVALGIGAAVGWNPARSSMLVLLLLMPAMIYAAARLLTMWPLVADRAPGFGAAGVLRAAFASTRGATARLLGAMLLYGLAYMVLTAAVQFGLGSVILLAAKAAGQEGAGRLLIGIVASLLGAVLQALWCVFATMVYRRLAVESTAT